MPTDYDWNHIRDDRESLLHRLYGSQLAMTDIDHMYYMSSPVLDRFFPYAIVEKKKLPSLLKPPLHGVDDQIRAREPSLMV